MNYYGGEYKYLVDNATVVLIMIFNNNKKSIGEVLKR